MPRFWSIALTACAVLAIAAAVGQGFYSQHLWWMEHNGNADSGTCVNHFGERYACIYADWMRYPLESPFAQFGMMIVSVLYFISFAAVAACIAFLGFLTKRLRSKQRKIFNSKN